MFHGFPDGKPIISLLSLPIVPLLTHCICGVFRINCGPEPVQFDSTSVEHPGIHEALEGTQLGPNRFIQERPILLKFEYNKWQVAIYLVLKFQRKIFTTFDAMSI
eukprot:sb/3477893/